MKDWKVWSVITGIIVLLDFGGTTIKFDDRYAKASEQKVMQANQKEILKLIDKINTKIDVTKLEDRKYDIEKEWEGKVMPAKVKDDVRFLEMMIKELKEQE